MEQKSTAVSAQTLDYHAEEEIEAHERFWGIIDGSFPDEAALRAQLASLGRDELVAFYALVGDASAMVRPSWDGPWVRTDLLEAGGHHLSEDSTADLTDWIVSQGRAYWGSACGGDDAQLQRCYDDYCAVRADEAHPLRWRSGKSGKTHLSGLTYSCYADRFGDDLYDALDALYAE
jgi:hypothetical protein